MAAISLNLGAQFQARSFQAVYPGLTPEDKVLASQWLRPQSLAPAIDDGYLLMESCLPTPPATVTQTSRTTLWSAPTNPEMGPFFRNTTDSQTGMPMLVEDFVDNLPLARDESLYLQFLPEGRVVASKGFGKQDHDARFDIKLTKIAAGIYQLYAWNPERSRWEMLAGEKLAQEQQLDLTNPEEAPLTRLIKLAFVQDRQSFLNSDIDFLQMQSLITLTLRTSEYWLAARNTVQIHRDFQKYIEDDNFTVAVGALIEASTNPNYEDDGTPEILFVKVVGDVANRLFGEFVTSQPSSSYPGHTWQHLEKMFRAYTATYVWYSLKIGDHIAKTAEQSVFERLASLSRTILAENIQPFANRAALQRALEIAQQQAEAAHLSAAAMDEITELLGIYDFMKYDD